MLDSLVHGSCTREASAQNVWLWGQTELAYGRTRRQHRLHSQRASLGAQIIKSLPAMWETRVWSLDWEDPLKKKMATQASSFAWKIPWTEEPSGSSYSPWGHKEWDVTEWLTHTLKGHRHNPAHSETQRRGSNLIKAWIRPSCWPWRASQRSNRSVGLSLKTQMLEAAVLQRLFYH